MDPFYLRLQSILIFLFLITIMPFLGKRALLRDCSKLSHGVQHISFWNPEVVWIIFIFSLLSGYRYDLGCDHVGYLNDYVNGVEAMGRGHEFLFHHISRIMYEWGLHPALYFGLWAFIQIFFFLLAFKDDRFIYPYLLLFVFLNGSYDSWMNGIRQDLAACIWIYSLRFIEKKKIVPYLLLALIEYGFHRSSIFLVVFYPLLASGKDYFKSIPLQISLFLGAVVLKQMVGSYVTSLDTLFTLYSGAMGGDSELYDHYNSEDTLRQINEANSSGTGLAVIFKGAVYLTIMLFSKKLKEYYNSRWFIIIYSLFIIGVCFEYLIPDGAVNLRRPFRYFVYFMTIILAYFVNYLIKNKSRNKNYSYYAAIIIIGFIGLFFLNRLLCSMEDHMMFQFLFQVPDYLWH